MLFLILFFINSLCVVISLFNHNTLVASLNMAFAVFNGLMYIGTYRKEEE